MKFKDLNTKSDTELKNTLAQSQAKLTQLRFQVGESKLKTVDQIGKTRKDIARIKTALSQLSK